MRISEDYRRAYQCNSWLHSATSETWFGQCHTNLRYQLDNYKVQILKILLALKLNGNCKIKIHIDEHASKCNEHHEKTKHKSRNIKHGFYSHEWKEFLSFGGLGITKSSFQLWSNKIIANRATSKRAQDQQVPQEYNGHRTDTFAPEFHIAEDETMKNLRMPWWYILFRTNLTDM